LPNIINSQNQVQESRELLENGQSNFMHGTEIPYVILSQLGLVSER